MIKKNLYRYLGKNGIITSLVELLNTDYLPMYRLEASANKILTNGEKQAYAVDVFPEEVDQWQEIDAPRPEKEIGQ